MGLSFDISQIVYSNDVVEKMEKKHGLSVDIVKAALDLDRNKIVRKTRRYGEPFYIVIAVYEGRVLFIVLKKLMKEFELITARDADEREKAYYIRKGK